LRLLLTALLIIIADQLSKHFITSMLQAGESIPLIEGFLHLTFVRNPGAAFGMLPYQTIFFVIITVAVVLFIVYYYRLLSTDHRLLRFSDSAIVIGIGLFLIAYWRDESMKSSKEMS